MYVLYIYFIHNSRGGHHNGMSTQSTLRCRIYVLRNFALTHNSHTGITPSTTNYVSRQKSTWFYWPKRHWTPKPTATKWPKSCVRRSTLLRFTWRSKPCYRCMPRGVPIYEGYCLPHAATPSLPRLRHQREIVRDIKEKLCAYKRRKYRKGRKSSGIWSSVPFRNRSLRNRSLRKEGKGEKRWECVSANGKGEETKGKRAQKSGQKGWIFGLTEWRRASKEIEKEKEIKKKKTKTTSLAWNHLCTPLMNGWKDVLFNICECLLSLLWEVLNIIIIALVHSEITLVCLWYS